MTLAKAYHYNGPGQGFILAVVVILAVVLSAIYLRIKARQARDVLQRRPRAEP
ncbi:MAG: hypothetical protein JWL79_2951 [Frankiales bacterium]|nr:hypothetical protein [Frankiales bacterium]